MKLAENVYLLGPQYGIGSNPTGGEILVAPVEAVDPQLFSLPSHLWFRNEKPFRLTQVVPPWNRRRAIPYEDGIARQWVYVYVRTTMHTDGPFGAPADGGVNPACRFFPGWKEALV